MWKKVLVILLIVAILFIASGCNLGNRNVGLDFKQSFDYAYIYGLNGELVVEGNVTSWRDFDESDVIQITIGDKTYLTHYVNVTMVRYDKKH